MAHMRVANFNANSAFALLGLKGRTGSISDSRATKPQAEARIAIMRGHKYCATILLPAVLTLAFPNGAHATGVELPVVGCPSDGQMGPLPAPANGKKAFMLEPAVASQLAYYRTSNMAVLAPRGWHCIRLYGSSGDALYVTPAKYALDQISGRDFKGISGPAVQLSYTFGGTSGRFAAAKVIAQVFPQQEKFVRDVIAEGIEPSSNFHFGPDPGDKITRLSKYAVEFETQGKAGLGGESWVLPEEGAPIRGLVILENDDNDILTLSIKLQKNGPDLADPIIRRTEEERRKEISR
jgi:hypothetical protein